MTVGVAIREAAEALAATSDTPRLDAELLIAALLGVGRSEMLLRHMGDPVPPGVGSLVARRMRHEPVAYILGFQEFYGREFAVGPGVLIPRADSETVIAAALAACPAPGRVLDCGVGSGALLLTVLAERPGASGIGVDRSLEAIGIAEANVRDFGLEERCQIRRADWSQKGWADDLGHFDLILANPPYVEESAELDPDVRDHEPTGALFAGPEGLDEYRLLVPQLRALLAPGGVAVLEIGHTQAEAVSAIAAGSGFSTTLHRDLAGRPRALVLV